MTAARYSRPPSADPAQALNSTSLATTDVGGFLSRVLQSIRELGTVTRLSAGIEAGIAIGPDTPVSALEGLLELVDLVQIMTVNPGWGGQPFLHGQLDKIHRLRTMLDERGLGISIGVDGGIKPDIAPLVVSAGATVLVSGSGVFNDRASVAENVAALWKSVTRPNRESEATAHRSRG